VNAARVEASRRAEVRSAARAWRRAGAIDAATLEHIEAAWPEGRPRMAAAWRVLIFVIVTVAANALFFAVATLIHGESGPGPWLFFAVCLSAATEILLHRSAIGENGSAAATSFWSVVYAVVGIALVEDAAAAGAESMITVSLLAATALFALAGWRWGYAAYGVCAAAAFFLLLARLPEGRILWLVAGAALLAAAYRLQGLRSLAPSHRRAAGGILLVAAAAVYVAVNRYSLDAHSIEALRHGAGTFPQPAPALGVLSAAATAVFPVLLIVWGLRSRRLLVLDAGLAASALSLATLRYYVHLAPLWAVLTAAGGALVLAALGLHRWLRRAADGERRGFTAHPLYGRGGRGLEAAAVVAAFAPAARPAPAPEPGNLTPGGGRYGGGGAEGSF